MSLPSRPRRRSCGRLRSLAAPLAAAAALAALLAGAIPGGASSSRAASAAPPEIVAQTDNSVPAREVTMIGATPTETGGDPGETWGVGTGSDGTVVVRYAAGGAGAGEWTLGPALEDERGEPLSGFQLDTLEAQGTTVAASPLAGQLTADGAGVLAGSVGGSHQVLLVREPNDPSSPFRETDPSPETQLEAGEQLLSSTRAPLLAPLDEDGHTGVLVVPVKNADEGIETSVLHWEGAARRWTREAIELPAGASPTEFRVLGLGASSPSNAWLLAQLSAGAVALFQRQGSGAAAVWQAVAEPGGIPGEPLRVKGEQLAIPGARGEKVRNQVLTVTSEGVWIDGERPEARASTTLYYKTQGAGAPSITSWCSPVSSPAQPCSYTLPEPLPSGASRSIAWANPSSATPYGERVITGLPEGVSLRLEGSSFERQLALGGSPGSAYGAAFSTPREGWLGNQELPVHLHSRTEAGENELSPLPVPFRHALLAIAPQPDEPAGSRESEALAVGVLGEVARYRPGTGWLPESLIGANGRRQTPQLRAVAWPVPNRAYAVGDEGQMWMWRGEAERWEPDPAEPYGFEGNLLGIAFDPDDPARGYAVGQGGVLLSYGKSWTQEQLPAESPCQPETRARSSRCTWSDTSFTSVAFAGSEALVAYRVLPETDTDRYLGGLLVNDGSGWHVDTEAAEVMGSNVPWATAGLPDGGAAFSASDAVYEREGPGEPWRQTAVPFPGAAPPGLLALFREDGALRAVVSGSVPNTYEAEKTPEAPPGSPPSAIVPYPPSTNEEAAILRQTADGWRDEERELNDAREPPGNWAAYDMVYQPDPVAAVLIDPSGSQGWAVGGIVEGEEHESVLDTADVWRLGEAAEAVDKPAAIETPADVASFAIGGNAQCAAPCADRAGAEIGPDRWLSSALHSAKEIHGVRAFLYTGPRLPSSRAIIGPEVAADHFSYRDELERYATILRGSGLPVFAASTPTDLDEDENEQLFHEKLGAFFPLGGPGAGLSAFSGPASSCAMPHCQSAYYAFTSAPEGGGSGDVRVIVLDDASETGEIEEEQRKWLEGELSAAKAEEHPAIVVGNPDLKAQIESGRHPGAANVVRILVEGHASAYFFDAPEENIREKLTYGAAEPVPAFGSGTLGYVSYQDERTGSFLGASGFLLAEVETARYDKSDNVAPVRARLIPNVGELALEAESGTLLRQSQVAVFSGLARRPRAGNRSAAGGAPHPETDPYTTLPSNCVSAVCETSALLPQFKLTSESPRVGMFVKENLASPEKDAVLLGPDERPISDEGGEAQEPGNEQTHQQSGLFCALEPGTTKVTISAGGLQASLLVTVEKGSARQPCSPQAVPDASQARASAPIPTPAPAGPAPQSAAPTTPAPPPPPAAPAIAAPHAPVPPPPPLLVQAIPAAPLPAAVPPPAPTPPEPTPPSGTAAVNSPVEAAQREEDSEEAVESSRANAVAYNSREHEPLAPYIVGMAIIAAAAGASIGRGRRGRGAARAAHAIVSSTGTQRRNDRDGRDWRAHR